MVETKIYVGLNDSETREQKYDTESYVKILRGVCKSYRVAFSFRLEQGGYMHDDGTYTQENTLVLTLIDAEKKTVNEIAKDLCAFFNQESVMITEDLIRVFFVREKI